MFLKNAWYVMAWSHEVAAKPLARRILGEPIVVYRTPNGSAVALADQCPHRRAPLSLGTVLEDGRLEC
jgi:vanillate O-demethylase monooxygenase subunit